MRVKFTVMGRAVPKRETQANRFGGVYGQQESMKTWRRTLHLTAKLNRPERLLVGPLRVVLLIYRRRKIDATPDTDNLEKPIWDSFQEIIYKNDSQIVDKRIKKCYSDDERIEVSISEVMK